MADKKLKIESLQLDLENPRTSQATSQRDALQQIVSDQDVRLVALAESIVEAGLNPMDRLLVYGARPIRRSSSCLRAIDDWRP